MNPKRIYSPIRYAGGKTKAAKMIADFIPPDTKRLISPFLGGASLELYVANTRDMEVIGYDIFQPLVEFWDVILKKPDELADALSEYRPTRECFTEVREELKAWWGKHRPIVERGDKFVLDNQVKFVAMYYYNHQYSYGPMFLGWPSSVYLTEKVHKKIIQRVREFRCPNLKVKLGGFEQTILKHDGELMYVDPPYYDDPERGNKLFKPLYPNCNFPIHHKGFNHEKLRDMLLHRKGGFILSYNDCPTIRKWYGDYQQKYPSWHYSYAQGESRVGENRIPSYVPEDIHDKVMGQDTEYIKETYPDNPTKKLSKKDYEEISKRRMTLLLPHLKEEDAKKIFKKESHEILVVGV